MATSTFARSLTLDVMLHVIEKCDLGTVRTLNRMPEYRPVLQMYHRSVLKNLHQNHEIPAGSLGTSKAVLAHKYIYGEADDPSTRDAVCVVFPVEDVNSLAEVEQRERRVDILLKAPFLRIQPGPSGRNYTWPRLSGKPRQAFRRVMKRALHQCDAIQDFEAQAVIECNASVSAYLFRPLPLPNIEPDCESCGVSKGGKSEGEASEGEALESEEPEERKINESTIEGQRNLHEIVIPNLARRLQIDYIKSLPTLDLMGIFMLIHVATTSWIESRTVAYDDAPRREALQENILRRGSCFLYCDVRGYGEMAKHRRQMLDDCMGILDTIADPDNDLLPSLYTTLTAELRARLGIPIEDLEAAVLDGIEKPLGSDEPVFATPPKLQERGVDPLY